MKQILNNQTLEVLRKSILKTIADAAPHIQAAKENQVKIVSQRFTKMNDWYMRVTGLDKVNLAQEKVTALQVQLLKIQDKRREVGRQLSEVRQKSMELQDEIHKVKRQEDLELFLDLMKKETEVLKLEKSISNTFQEYDQTERELFTAFTDSIRDSHEKQRSQMEYTKYFGIVLSIAGSFLAFIYSTLKKEQLKQIIDERLQAVNKGDVIFVGDLVRSNEELKMEVVNNRKVLSEFADAVTRKLSQLERNSEMQYLKVKTANSDDNYELIRTAGGDDDVLGSVVALGVMVGVGLILAKLFSG